MLRTQNVCILEDSQRPGPGTASPTGLSQSPRPSPLGTLLTGPRQFSLSEFNSSTQVEPGFCVLSTSHQGLLMQVSLGRTGKKLLYRCLWNGQRGV